MPEKLIGSRDVAAAAIKMALSAERVEEKAMQQLLSERGITAAAVDFGGDLVSSASKIIERAIVAAKREGLIGDYHNEEGAVAGAAREAFSQIASKAMGFSIGGKIGVARSGEHICVALFFSISLVHLNEMGLGLGHRVI